MEEYERRSLLERVERESATIGATIPERLDIDGESVPLRQRILELQGAESLTPEEEAERNQLLTALRSHRTTLLERIEHEEIDRDTGVQLAEQVISIDRAQSALRAVGEDTDIEEEMRKQRVADAERWRTFIKRSTQGIDRSLGR